MDFRTDLAIEIKESLLQKAPEGIETAAFEKNGVKVTKIKITNSEGMILNSRGLRAKPETSGNRFQEQNQSQWD